MDKPFYEKPCAIPGLISYRYRSSFGWVMIGATDHHDAMQQVARSINGAAHANLLQVWDWDAGKYVDACA